MHTVILCHIIFILFSWLMKSREYVFCIICALFSTYHAQSWAGHVIPVASRQCVARLVFIAPIIFAEGYGMKSQQFFDNITRLLAPRKIQQLGGHHGTAIYCHEFSGDVPASLQAGSPVDSKEFFCMRFWERQYPPWSRAELCLGWL